MLIAGVDRMTAGLRMQFRRLEYTADNQANSSTPGFRQTLAGLRSGELSSWRDDSEGRLGLTGRGFDIALPEGVYLLVDSPGGKRYTRRGDLKVDPQGFLTLGSGERVLADNESPIRIQDFSQAVLSQDGEVTLKGKSLAKLGRYRVGELVNRGGSLLEPVPGSQVVEADDPIRTGALELSNVEIERNQTDLMETVQRARIYAQAALVQDGTVDRALREILGR